MSYKLSDIRKVEIEGKRVFVRVDLDAPLAQQSTINSQQLTITDDARLRAGLPTIQYLLEHGAIVIIGGHLGRPKSNNQQSTINNQQFSLEPIVQWLAEKFRIQTSLRRQSYGASATEFRIEKVKIGGFEGWELSNRLFLLENLRFYEGEESNDPQFAKKLASLADIYVNDAFATTHRNHASVVGITNYLPHFAGLNLQKEVDSLSRVLENPTRPLVVIIGGEKIETKLPLAYKMLQLANYVLVGGKIAQEESTLLQMEKEAPKHKSVLMIAGASEDKTDISEKSMQDFLEVIKLAKTIVWNGPMGKINSEFRIQNSELGETERGTKMVAKGIAESSAYKVVGGGDTVGFLKRNNLISKFDFVSTGGGAMLSFLSGEKMPGIEVLLDKEPSWSHPTMSR